MKVKALIELLKQFDENANVLLASDPSGNEFNPLSPIIEECDNDVVDEQLQNTIVLYPYYEL